MATRASAAYARFMRFFSWVTAACIVISVFWTSVAEAHPSRRDTFRIEVGIETLECGTCHRTNGGGDACASPPCFNRFGEDYSAELPNGAGVWSRIADLDSDGDGYSNRLEFGDENGDDISEHGVVSPAHEDRGDLDECAIGMVTCSGSTPFCRNTLTCSPAGRPSYECTARPVAAPARSFIDDPWNRARAVGSNEWVPVDSYYDYNPNVPSECGVSAPSVWLRYQGECAGIVKAEVRTERGIDPTSYIMGRYNTPAGDCTPDEAPEEVACGATTRGLRVGALSTGGRLIRVMGRIRGEMRLYCAPISTRCLTAPDFEDYPEDDPIYEHPPSDAVACGQRNVSCEYAEPVIEGRYVVDVGAGFCGPDRGTWLAYTASCTGQVHVDSAFHWNDDANREHAARLALYRGMCPGSGPEGECLSARSSNLLDYTDPPREVLRHQIDAIVGETVYIFVAGDGQEKITVACEADVNPELCSHCDESADCEFDSGEGTVSCVCPDGTGGDGLSLSHGGEGCVHVPSTEECTSAGLFCDELAYCVAIPGAPSCQCRDGFFGSGFSCVETNACEEYGCSGHRKTCIDNLKGLDCICETGYSRDPNEEELTCIRICGDGFKAPGEFCDDGNYIDGDGCSATCEIEFSFACRTVGEIHGLSECRNTCGDGLIDENEALLCERTLAELCDCKAAPGRPARFGWGGLAFMGVISVLGFRRRRSRRSSR